MTVSVRDAADALRVAIALSEAVRGTTSPHPSVRAVLGAGAAVMEDAGVSTITEMRRCALEEVTMSGGDVRLCAVPQVDAHDEEAVSVHRDS